MNDITNIHALADNELDAETKQMVEASLSSDPAARREFEAVCALKAVMSRVDPTECDAVWKKCTKRLDELDKSRKVEGLVTRNAWALCAVFAVAILGAGVMNKMRPTVLPAADAAYAASSIPLGNAEARYLEQLPVPKDQRVIDGGRMEMNGVLLERYELVDGRGALTLLHAVGAQISGCSDIGGGFEKSIYNGRPAIIWADSGGTWILISDRDTGSLISAAAVLRERL